MITYENLGRLYVKTKNRDYFIFKGHLYFYDHRKNRYDEVTNIQLRLGASYKLYFEALTNN